MATFNNPEKVNALVKMWGKRTRGQLAASLQRMGIRDKGRLMKSLRMRTGMDIGLVNRVSYTMLRYGGYVEAGVGRGTKADQVAGSKRKAKPWSKPILDAEVSKLADVIMEAWGADVTINIKFV